jgi:hypothetical protein
MAEMTKCKLSNKREVGNPMLYQGKHATKNPGKQRHRGGKIGENLPWPEALRRRKQPWCGSNKKRHQSIHDAETTDASSKPPKSLASESELRDIGKQDADFPHNQRREV